MAQSRRTMASRGRRRAGFRAGWPALGLASILLTACSGWGLKETPAAGTDLSGLWKLDPARSTDTHSVLAQLNQARMSHRPAQENPQGVANGPAGPRTGRPAAQESLDAQLRLPIEDVPPDISEQMEELRGGEFLRIVQKPDELTITNAARQRSFTPGGHSVVSVPDGVADQRSGWKGREYRIEIRPQEGPKVEETYRLSDDGRQLIQTIHIGSDGRIPAVQVTRVYTPTHETPAALPSGD